jgi:hypothetical protein
MLNDLTRQELVRLLKAYDEYIQEANDHDRYSSGWRPMSVEEYYDEEFSAQDVLDDMPLDEYDDE